MRLWRGIDRKEYIPWPILMMYGALLLMTWWDGDWRFNVLTTLAALWVIRPTGPLPGQ